MLREGLLLNVVFLLWVECRTNPAHPRTHLNSGACSSALLSELLRFPGMDCNPQLVSINMQPYDAKQQGRSDPPYSCPELSPSLGFPVKQPRDFVLWSLFNTIFCDCCCLGFLALVFSVKARDRKLVGDINGASAYGRTARSLNITNVVLAILFIIMIIIVLAQMGSFADVGAFFGVRP
uniref:Uncharacterized protein n=1 Tax=Sphenodon punctatus TaxID=8508 RepID=A0A8D0GTK3_SPHPU